MPKLDDNIEQKFILYDLQKDSQICPVDQKEDKKVDKAGPSKERTQRKNKQNEASAETKESKTERRLFTSVNLTEAPEGVRTEDWNRTDEFVVRPTATTDEEYKEIAGSYYCSDRSIPSVRKSKKVKYNVDSTCTVHEVGYEVWTLLRLNSFFR